MNSFLLEDAKLFEIINMFKIMIIIYIISIIFSIYNKNKAVEFYDEKI